MSSDEDVRPNVECSETYFEDNSRSSEDSDDMKMDEYPDEDSDTPMPATKPRIKNANNSQEQVYSNLPPKGRELPPMSGKPRPILFYEQTKPYFGFTTFSPDPVQYDGKLYVTSGHLFQARKFLPHRPLLAEHIRTCHEGLQIAYTEAQRFLLGIRADWYDTNIEVMDEILALKFTQHEHLSRQLMETGDAELIENSGVEDAFWGNGADGNGKNELGKALMRLRGKTRTNPIRTTTSGDLLNAPTSNPRPPPTALSSIPPNRQYIKMDNTVRLCAHCGERPRYGTFPYCGRTCARLHLTGPSATVGRVRTAGAPQVRQPVPLPPPRPVPVTPKRMPPDLPPAADTPASYLYPSYTGSSTTSVSTVVDTPTSGTSSRFAPSPSVPRPIPERNGTLIAPNPTAPPPPPVVRDPGAPKCLIPDCEAPPFRFGAEYCTVEHRQLAAKDKLAMRCVRCKQLPVTLFNFCGQYCEDRAARRAPQIYTLDSWDPKFDEIRERFDTCWKDTAKAKPAVKLVWKVVMTKPLMESFFAYRKTVESKRNFTAQKAAPANECRKWYGLRRDCNIGDDETQYTLCNSGQCAVCYILKHSFRKEILWNTRTGHFGSGIYTSASSSRADDFTSNGAAKSPLKAMLMATVIVGKGLKCTTPRTSYTAAPKGYDSVLAETGSSMVFDEVVVYDNDAIRPVWLVIYEP